MNTPFVWILLPGLLAIILLVINRWERVVVITSSLTAGALAVLAWWLPIGQPLVFGPLTIEFVDTWSIFGRRFVLGETDRPALVVMFLAVAFWSGGAYVARTRRSFVPLALGMIAILIAAISVQPFLYAALLIELAVLVSIPFLIPPGGTVSRGILRYLTFQTLGVPFILFSGWMLSGVETNPGSPELGMRAAVLIGLGFTFLLAVFPFHSWVPMLAQESHPYSVAFIFLLLPSAITFFGLGFLDQFAWIRNSPEIHLVLRNIGLVMVIFSGIWAAFQRHLGRILGYAILFEIGLTILSIGLAEGEYAGLFLEILFVSLLPRGVALGVWALALTVIRSQADGLDYSSVQGVARQFPLAAGALVFAHFTWVGVPLTAGFPARWPLWENIPRISSFTAILVFLGGLGLLIGGIRSLSVLVMGSTEGAWQVSEERSQRVFLVLGICALLLIGLFPQWFLPFFANLPQAFEHLMP